MLLSENRLLKTALKLKSIIMWKLKSHQIFHWKTEGAASPSARQNCCSWRVKGAEQPRGWTVLPSSTSLTFLMLLKLPLLLTPWIWYAFHADIDLGQERWWERVCTVIGKERGCSVPEPLPTPIPSEKAPSARCICQSPSAFQDYDALWFYSFPLEVLLKYKQHSISAGIKEIQIKKWNKKFPKPPGTF